MERNLIRKSKVWSPEKIEEIQEKAQIGRYRIRGQATKRMDLPSFDDLVFTPAGLSRVPLEGYRERCDTKVVIGEGKVKRPLVLETPIMIAGMSFGAINAHSKKALGIAATRCGISTCTGDGGMHPIEREYSEKLVYQLLPSRYGLNPYDLKKADAVEIVVSQGAKPGTGGTLLGHKVSEEVAKMRDLPAGVDQRSPCRHPDWMGPDDLGVKVEQIREATDYEVPIFIKIGAGRVYDDVKLAAKVGVEAVVIDGMEGGTAASPEIQLDHTGIPTISAVVEAAQALYDIGMKHEVKLIIGGGISNGADAAKAIALGADVVYMGSAMLIALNCQRPIYIEDYHALGTEPGACHHCHTGKCPVGIATQDPELMARLDPTAAAERVENYINSITMEMQIFARSCGKSRVSDLDPTDLRSLTLVTSYITGVPLVGLGGKKPYFASLDHGSSFKDLLKV
ncbi:MAG: FMN-binding glutamate synthase family protein [Bacillaceae bacterium]|jgi:Glutamate synthase domain 2|uniref:Glutamate synthase n=1 Tax=Aeribacillus pallidus TaxID=33936 RepID=A0A161YXH8_9BACI|nr:MULTISPECIES: FMN-binding glutamate synthase family protein [Aeribacillus]AXI39493.1 FMN-binding glutamate synthase family protein [Bacillaceae bacterium ZC4]REJ15157.1 MAG: FMN-binding glutamate synthase family protein [Bacillaceae bacterium]KZM53675.1 glutamate synthase [Aeribacillus pallidus]KZN94986.1 glutamate synthase [Aeribacillus pallidus]MDR9792105.1 FMN-binding glutamate synthase family protein [Aeribacillus pallidus]